MANPTIVDTTTTVLSSHTGGNYTVDIGTVAEGNLILIEVWSADDTVADIFTLSGYTKLFEVGNGGANICECKIAAWWKVAGASETDPDVATTGNNEYFIARAVEISGQDATPIDFTPPTGETTGGSVASFSITGDTTVTADCIVFGMLAMGDGTISNSTTGGAGWTETYDAQVDAFSHRAVEFRKTMSGTGATGTITATPSSNNEGAWAQIAIAPAAAAGDQPLVLYTSPGLSVTNP